MIKCWVTIVHCLMYFFDVLGYRHHFTYFRNGAFMSANPIQELHLGGGIFSFLPVAKQTDIFETFFGTPHSNDFLSVAEMFGLNYFRPNSISAFVKDYRQAVIQNKSAVIEIFTERDKNPQQLEALAQKLMKCAFESS